MSEINIYTAWTGVLSQSIQVQSKRLSLLEYSQIISFIVSFTDQSKLKWYLTANNVQWHWHVKIMFLTFISNPFSFFLLLYWKGI